MFYIVCLEYLHVPHEEGFYGVLLCIWMKEAFYVVSVFLRCLTVYLDYLLEDFCVVNVFLRCLTVY